MKTFAAASILSLLTLTSAAPAASTRINPYELSLYTVWTGAVQHNVNTGKIVKPQFSRTSDITTLVTFKVPSAAAGKTCTFHFSLPNPPVALSGTKKFDLYSSQAPATTDTTTWPKGNLRDQYLGRFTAVAGGEATPGADGITTKTTFPCPAGQLYATELVGVGDLDDIEFNKGTGPYLTY